MSSRKNRRKKAASLRRQAENQHSNKPLPKYLPETRQHGEVLSMDQVNQWERELLEEYPEDILEPEDYLSTAELINPQNQTYQSSLNYHRTGYASHKSYRHDNHNSILIESKKITLYGIPRACLDYEKNSPIVLLQDYSFPDHSLKTPWGFIVNWVDFGLPKGKYNLDFWRCFLDDLLIPQTGPDKSITVACTGAHGRTGTLLSIFLHILAPHILDPVLWLRDNYCERAVESQEQVNYLSSLGVQTNEKVHR